MEVSFSREETLKGNDIRIVNNRLYFIFLKVKVQHDVTCDYYYMSMACNTHGFQCYDLKTLEWVKKKNLILDVRIVNNRLSYSIFISFYFLFWDLELVLV